MAHSKISKPYAEMLVGAGNNADDERDMRRLGNKQEFKRGFHPVAVLGLTSILVQTWAGMMVNIPYSLTNGGRAGSVWSFFGTWVFQVPLVASLAEMASMAPTCAGQYHWISEFAPASIQKPLSYVSGWLAALGWQSAIAATSYGAAGILTTMISVGKVDYEPRPWHVTLLMLAIGIVAILFNVFAAKRMPLSEGAILFCYILGFFVVIIPLWIIAPKVSATEVFTKFDNYGEWSSVAAAAVIGQTSAAGALFGFDSAAHISEEVRNAALSVPRMMMAALFLNGALGFVMVISFCFVLQDTDKQIIQSDSAFPWVDVFATATNSNGWALGMAACLLMINFSACINATMAASRQIWSLGRDSGVPYPGFFTRIVRIDSTPVPINAMLVSLFILIVLALVNLGSSKIINILLGLAGGAIGSSYILSISCVLWRRTLSDNPLPTAKWSLGRYGAPINAIAIAYQTMSTTLGFFPVTSHIDPSSMNWSIVVFGGAAILCAITYMLVGRRHYTGPVARVTKEE